MIPVFDDLEQLVITLVHGSRGQWEWSKMNPGYTGGTVSPLSYTLLDITGSGVFVAAASPRGSGVYLRVVIDGSLVWWIISDANRCVPLMLPFHTSLLVQSAYPPGQEGRYEIAVLD